MHRALGFELDAVSLSKRLSECSCRAWMVWKLRGASSALVNNILSKLHLADRPQAAALAWREGAVRKT